MSNPVKATEPPRPPPPPTTTDLLAAINVLSTRLDAVKAELDTLAALDSALAAKLDSLELGMYSRLRDLTAIGLNTQKDLAHGA